MRPPSTPTSMPAWLRPSIAFGLVGAAALAAAWSTLDRGFLGDDFAYVGRFLRLPAGDWPGLFLRDWSGGIWGSTLPELRPFAALTLLVDSRIWGVNPLGYHLTNFALDAGCALLVLLIVWRLHQTALWVGCAAGILFAWHPAHAEPVAWITGRVDLLGTLAYLAGFLAGGLYLRDGGPRRWLVAAWLAYAVGCFSKEFCLTLPVALLVWWLAYRGRQPVTTTRQVATLFAGFVLIAAGFLLCRRLAFGPGGGSGFALSFLSAAFAERQVDYLRWFLPPLYDFGRDHRPTLAANASILVLASLGLSLAGLVLWRWRGAATTRWRATAFFGLGWYLVATLPMAAASYFSPRHLYLATAGLAIWAGILLGTLAYRRWVAFGVAAIAALFCASRLDHAIAPWRHSAKVSERVAAAITRSVPQLRAGEVLLVDVPEVYEGVWLWAWATPFALQPPFQGEGTASVTLTRPATYYAGHLWTRQPAFQALATANGAVLLTLDPKGEVVSRHVDAGHLAAPARELAAKAGSEPDVAWRGFVATLLAR